QHQLAVLFSDHGVAKEVVAVGAHVTRGRQGRQLAGRLLLVIDPGAVARSRQFLEGGRQEREPVALHLPGVDQVEEAERDRLAPPAGAWASGRRSCFAAHLPSARVWSVARLAAAT